MFRIALRHFSSSPLPRQSSSLLGTVVERGDSKFAQTLKEAGNAPVLVDFYADWCGPCRMLAPILKKVVEQNNQTFLVKVNTDEAVQTASEFQIAALPTVGIFKNGKLVDQFVGLRDEAFIKAFIQKYV